MLLSRLSKLEFADDPVVLLGSENSAVVSWYCIAASLSFTKSAGVAFANAPAGNWIGIDAN